MLFHRVGLLLLLRGDTIHLDVGGTDWVTALTTDGLSTVGVAGHDGTTTAVSTGTRLLLLLLQGLLMCTIVAVCVCVCAGRGEGTQ